MPTLYIVDGESSAGSLRGHLPEAEILSWRDALYDGPVPGGLSLQELSRIRASYWNAGGEFSKRDRALKRFAKFEEIVLWFGPTVVCQLSLIQLLDWFSAQDCPSREYPTLSLIDWQYAGWLPPDKMAPHLERRRPVTAAILRVARKAWKAFTASDPKPLQQFLHSDSSALPELRPILIRIAQEYPDASGLSRVERKLLAQFRRPIKAAAGVGKAMAGETFGDSYYYDALDRFIGATNQLLCFSEPPSGNLRASHLAATDFGRKVLAGKADSIASDGIDRWIGGVHLEGREPPRRSANLVV